VEWANPGSDGRFIAGRGALCRCCVELASSVPSLRRCIVTSGTIAPIEDDDRPSPRGHLIVTSG
jgi:hypothetical protein